MAASKKKDHFSYSRGKRASQPEFESSAKNILKVTGETSSVDVHFHTMKAMKQNTECSSNINSFHHAMSSVIVAAQCFGLFPVQGVTSSSAAFIRFRWCSVRVIYSIFCMLGASVNIIFSLSLLESMGLTFERIDKVVFYGTSAVTYFQCLQLARYWHYLAVEWENLELSQKHYGYPRKLQLKIRLLTSVVLIGALVEHALSHINIMRWATQCTNNIHAIFQRYFTNVHSQLFRIVLYNIPLAVCNEFFNITATFTWNFTDLFIMLVSMALTERFYLFNQHLTSVRGKLLPESFWHQVREEYTNLSGLTKLLDSFVSRIVLVSFASNLYFICRQLLSSITPLGNIYEEVYFYWSFGFVLFRTLMVSINAARIYEESQCPKAVLFSVPSESYNIEVSRLLYQTTTDSVVLTGMNFFSVTRTLLLTLAGTIVTYEIVLVQFNNTNSTTKNSTIDAMENITNVCQM